MIDVQLKLHFVNCKVKNCLAKNNDIVLIVHVHVQMYMWKAYKKQYIKLKSVQSAKKGILICQILHLKQLT